MKRRKLIVEEIIHPSDQVLCDYGCGEPAKYIIGVAKRPCCSDKPGKCKHVAEKNVLHGRATKKQRYGSETYNNSEQRAKTNLDKYGNVCSLHGKEQEEMTKQSFMTKYGVDCAFKSSEVQAKVTETIRKNHGVDNPWQIPEVIARIQAKNATHQQEITQKAIQTRQSWSEQYLESIKQSTKMTVRIKRYPQLFDNPYVQPLFTLEEYLKPYGSLFNLEFPWKCKICGNAFTSEYKAFKPTKDTKYIYGRCPNCFCHAKSDGVSIEELEVLDFVKSIYPGQVIHSKKILKDETHNYQLDIFLPEMKFGIEYNGLYFHQVKNCPIEHYHFVKTRIAEQLGIRLMHLRSDQWLNQTSKFKGIIKSIIDGKFSLADFYKHQETIVVDRALFNKCFSIQNYHLVEETDTSILTIQSRSCSYDYEDCGQLIYKKSDV